MAFISNGTTVATGGSLQNVPAPSSSDVATAITGISTGAVGSHGFFKRTSVTQTNPGDQVSGNDLKYSNGNGNAGTNPGGTWKCMAFSIANSNSASRTTLYVRLS